MENMENQELIFNSCSEADTSFLGESLAAILPEGRVIALFGELGSGKTALSRALFHARGYLKGVMSPSYTIINEYSRPGHTACHMDVYRIVDPGELFETGYYDCFEYSELTVIEWADLIINELPEKRIEIRISRKGLSEERVFSITGLDTREYRELKEKINAYSCS